MQTSIEHSFADVAHRFCDLIEQRERIGREGLVGELLTLLPELYITALTLRSQSTLLSSDFDDLDVSDDDSGMIAESNAQSHAAWNEMYASVDEIFQPNSNYLEIFNPWVEDEPVYGSISDDIADIYRDLRDGLEYWNSGRVELAVRDWTEGFESHWGRHLVSLLRALHALRFSGEVD